MPLVPVTVTTIACGAVDPAPNPPEQPTNAITLAARVPSNSDARNAFASGLRRNQNKHTATEAKPSGASGAFRVGIKAADTAVRGKVTVRADVAPAVPGVTAGGLNVAVAPAGSPEAERTTKTL